MHAFSPSTSKLHASGVLCLLSRQLISWRIQCPSLINYLCMEFINDAIGVCVETSILPTLQGRTFAFVTFKDAAAAAAVVETGHMTITAPAAGGAPARGSSTAGVGKWLLTRKGRLCQQRRKVREKKDRVSRKEEIVEI